MTVGYMAAPAAAQEPSVITDCTLGSGDSRYVSLRLFDFPPSETFPFWARLEYGGPGNFEIYDRFGVTTDASGTSGAGPVPLRGIPMHLRFVVFRDTNGSGRWDDGDETVHQSEATLTTCPQSVTNSPK
jgi:hypothetical protein